MHACTRAIQLIKRISFVSSNHNAESHTYRCKQIEDFVNRITPPAIFSFTSSCKLSDVVHRILEFKPCMDTIFCVSFPGAADGGCRWSRSSASCQPCHRPFFWFHPSSHISGVAMVRHGLAYLESIPSAASEPHQVLQPSDSAKNIRDSSVPKVILSELIVQCDSFSFRNVRISPKSNDPGPLARDPELRSSLDEAEVQPSTIRFHSECCSFSSHGPGP